MIKWIRDLFRSDAKEPRVAGDGKEPQAASEEKLCVWSKPLSDGTYLNYSHQIHGVKPAVKGHWLCKECMIEDPYE